ncbi:MAG: flagellar biosynthesis anti-sigma factor FlgM [Candidatus Kryptonium sp.]|nr:flagellar biosynthesis anti-sigma factor FlgM [Candidatus Kryptonium sp.]MCX7762122.1 flagellar biosynthesis anti-sigma factor FlgM [Candidatus Kryptonium sp.]MDW8108275.1 flagellar biosynthesis anti-sigma factor FlgM [Candidatus Kryptonium sp.]
MRINEISGKIPLPEENSGRKTQKTEEKKDKIEISSEAREIYRLKRAERIEEVKKKIETGFYNSDDVIDKVAEKVYSLFKIGK